MSDNKQGLKTKKIVPSTAVETAWLSWAKAQLLVIRTPKGTEGGSKMPPADVTAAARDLARDAAWSLRERTDALLDAVARGEIQAGELAEKARPFVEQAHRRAALLACGGDLTPQAESVARGAAEFHLRQAEAGGDRLTEAGALPLYTFEECLRKVAHFSCGIAYERRVLPHGGCCDECAAHAARGWVPAGSLPELFDSECLTGCGCHFEFADSPPPGGWGGAGGDGVAEFGIPNATGIALGGMGGGRGPVRRSELLDAVSRGIDSVGTHVMGGIDVVGRHLARLGRRAGILPNASVGEHSPGKWYEVGADGPKEQHSDFPRSAGRPGTIKSGPRKGQPCLRDGNGHIIDGRAGIVGGRGPSNAVITRPKANWMADAREAFSPSSEGGQRVPPMVGSDGSIHVGGGKALVHVNEHGEIDHGPAHLRGRTADLTAEGGPKVDSGERMSDIRLRGDPARVAQAYAAQKAFEHNAPKEIEHIRQSVRSASLADGLADHQTADRRAGQVADHLTATMKALTAGPSGGEDRSAHDVFQALNHSDPRTVLLTHAPPAPGGVLDKTDAYGGSHSGKSAVGRFHHLLGGKVALVAGLHTPSLREFDLSRPQSPAMQRATQLIHDIGNSPSPEDIGRVRDAVSAMTPAEAYAFAHQVAGGVSVHYYLHEPKDAGEHVANHLAKETRLKERTAQSAAQKQADDLIQAVQGVSSFRGTAAQRRESAVQHLNNLGALAGRGLLRPEHLTQTASHLRRGFSIQNLAALHRAVHGQDARGVTKEAVIRSLLSRHQAAVGGAHFDMPAPSVGELLVNWGGEVVTQDVAAACMAEEGLSEEAIDLVLSACEVAEEEENDRLVPAVCMALSMRVQSLLFPKDSYTEAQAVAWAEGHDYAHDKVDTTENFHRVRQFDPGDCKGEPRTIAFKKAKGVKAVVCPMKAAEHAAEPAPPLGGGEVDGEVELVWCDGQIWDTTSVLLSLLDSGVDDWTASQFLESYERVAEFAGGSDIHTDPKTGREFIWRNLHGSNCMIFMDGQQPAVQGPKWLASRMNGHGHIEKAARDSKGKSAAERIQAVHDAAQHSARQAGEERSAARQAKQARQDSRDEVRVSRLLGAGKAVGRVAGAGLKKLAGTGKRLSAKGRAKLLALRIAAREKAKAGAAAAGAAAGKALAVGKKVKDAYGHEGGGTLGARRWLEKAVGWAGKKSGAAGTLLGQALAEGHAKAKLKWNRGAPARERGESKEDYKARREAHVAALRPKLKAFKAARLNSMREELQKGGLQIGNRVKVAVADLRARLFKSKNADGTPKSPGLVRKSVGGFLKTFKYMGNVQKYAGEALERKIKEKYPGIAGKAAVSIGRTLNRLYTAHGILGAIGAAGVVAGTVAGGHVGLGVGIAALQAGWALKGATLGHGSRKWMALGLLATTMGAGAGMAKAIGSLARSPKTPDAKMAFGDEENTSPYPDDPQGSAPGDDDYNQGDGQDQDAGQDDDWGSDVDPDDLPDDFDWNVASQMAVEVVNETLQKMGQWMHQHRDEMADVDKGFGDEGDAAGDPDQWAKDVPDPTFSCEGVENSPLPGLEDVRRRAEFLRGTPYAEFARDEALPLFDAIDAWHGHGASRVALVSAALTPLPGAPAVEAALCDLALSYQGEPLAAEPLDISPREAEGAGACLALALAEGWRRR